MPKLLSLQCAECGAPIRTRYRGKDPRCDQHQRKRSEAPVSAAAAAHQPDDGRATGGFSGKGQVRASCEIALDLVAYIQREGTPLLAVNASSFYQQHPASHRVVKLKSLVRAHSDLLTWFDGANPGLHRIEVTASGTSAGIRSSAVKPADTAEALDLASTDKSAVTSPAPSLPTASTEGTRLSSSAKMLDSKRANTKVAPDSEAFRKARKHFVKNESNRFAFGGRSRNVETAEKVRKSCSKAMKLVLRDRTLWSEMVELGRPAAWLAADPALRLNREYTQELLAKSWRLFPFIDESLITATMVLEVATETIAIFEMLSEFRGSAGTATPCDTAFALDDAAMDKEAAIDAVTKHWWVFAFIPTSLKRDRDVIFAAMDSCSQEGDRHTRFDKSSSTPKCVLELLSESLQHEEDVVLKSIWTESSDSENFTPISRIPLADQGRLLDNTAIFWAACQRSPNAGILQMLSPECPMLDDLAAMMRVISFGHDVLEHASKRLKGDSILVRAAVVAKLGSSTSLNPFTFASDALKADKAFVLELLRSVAAAQNRSYIERARNLPINRAILQALLTVKSWHDSDDARKAYSLPSEIWEKIFNIAVLLNPDPHFSLYGSRCKSLCPRFLDCVADPLQTDKDVLLAALQGADELPYRALPAPLNLDKELAVAAVTAGGIVYLRRIDHCFRSDRDLWRLILTLHPIEFLESEEASEMRQNYVNDTFYSAGSYTIDTKVNVLKYAPPAILRDQELALIAARQADSASAHIPWSDLPLQSYIMLARVLPVNRSILWALLTVKIRHDSDDKWKERTLPSKIWNNIFDIAVFSRGDSTSGYRWTRHMHTAWVSSHAGWRGKRHAKLLPHLTVF